MCMTSEPSTKEEDMLDQRTIDDFKAGTPIAELSRQTGLKRGKLRRMLKKSLGGSLPTREIKREGPVVSDKEVEVLPHAKGWKSRVIYVHVGGPQLKGTDIYAPYVSESVFTSPDGEEYVIAKNSERADLLIQTSVGIARLRHYQSSSIGRRHSETSEMKERGDAALKRERKVKKERRLQRKKRRSAQA